MGKGKCLVKILRQNSDGTKLAEICGVEVMIYPYDSHPNKYTDPRIPGYYEKQWPEGCINCCFRHNNRNAGEFDVYCGLTLDDRRYFSGVKPLGKCKKYKMGKSLSP